MGTICGLAPAHSAWLRTSLRCRVATIGFRPHMINSLDPRAPEPNRDSYLLFAKEFTLPMSSVPDPGMTATRRRVAPAERWKPNGNSLPAIARFVNLGGRPGPAQSAGAATT